MDRKCESFYESPILTQQPPSPLHPSPVAEEQRCVPDPDSKVEVGNPETLHHSPENEYVGGLEGEPSEADHSGSEKERSSDVKTVHEHSDQEREELERVIESIVVAEEEKEHEMGLEVGEGLDTVHAVPVREMTVLNETVHAGVDHENPVQGECNPDIVMNSFVGPDIEGRQLKTANIGDKEKNCDPPIQSPSLQQMILYSPNRWTADHRRGLYKHEPIVQARCEDIGELYRKTQPGTSDKEVYTLRNVYL